MECLGAPVQLLGPKPVERERERAESKRFCQVNRPSPYSSNWPVHPMRPLSTEDVLILVSKPRRSLLHLGPKLLHWLARFENSSRLRLALPLWEDSPELFTEGVGPRDRPEDTGSLLVGVAHQLEHNS